jgi:hypothetical protein
MTCGLREPIEGAAHHDSQRVQGGFYPESEHGPLEPAREKRFDHAVGRRRRMDVDRHVKRLGGREDVPVFGIVEIFAVRVQSKALLGQTGQVAH